MPKSETPKTKARVVRLITTALMVHLSPKSPTDFDLRIDSLRQVGGAEGYGYRSPAPIAESLLTRVP